MQIDMTPILGGDTDRLQIDFPLVLDENVGDISFPRPISVSGAVINMAGYMTLELEAKVPFATECARCLAPVEGELTFSYVKNVAQEKTLQNEDNDDYVFIRSGKLDVDETLLEQIMLEIPQKILCREDCRGLCPKCGKNLNVGECGCPQEKEIDPRLEAIARLFPSGEK